MQDRCVQHRFAPRGHPLFAVTPAFQGPGVLFLTTASGRFPSALPYRVALPQSGVCARGRVSASVGSGHAFSIEPSELIYPEPLADTNGNPATITPFGCVTDVRVPVGA